MDRSKPTRLCFGPFEVDFDVSELYDSGQRVHLQSKPFQFLTTLLQHPGEIVTREQMSHVLWPNIYVQVNQGLNAAARKVRIALNDRVERPHYFETLGSQGYRFVHDIEVLAWSGETESAADVPLRMAVMSFQSDDPDQFSGEGVAAELAGLLGRIHPRLKVVSPSSNFRIQPPFDMDVVASRMNVRLVLTGTVQRHRNRVSVSATLLDLAEHKPVWEWSSERNSGDLFDLLQEIVVQVLEVLPTSSVPSSAVVPSLPRTDLHNYLGFIQALHAWHQQTNAAVVEALGQFQKSAERDPDYGPAHAGVANAHIVLARHEVIAPRTAYQAALRSAATAMQLNPELPEAMVAMAWAKLAMDHDWVIATRLYERALQANSSYAFGYVGLGTLLMARGRVDEGVDAIQQADQLDPLSPFTSASLSTALYYARRYDEAIRQARLTLELDPTANTARAVIGLSSLAQRRYSEALQHFEAAAEDSHDDPVMEAHLAHAYARVGKISSAEPILVRLENRNGNLPKPSFHIAVIKLALGDVNGAVRWLEQACRERFERTLFLGVDPRLDVLRGTRHFEEMCKQVREPDLRHAALERIPPRGGAA